MQTLKRTLSLLLCCVLLAAFAPMVCAEEKILIEKAYATYSVPVAGKPFDFSNVIVPDDAPYTAEITKVYYYRDGGYKNLSDGDIVENCLYYVQISFSANSGYRLEFGTTEYTINGTVADTMAGTYTPRVSFFPINMNNVWVNVPEDATVDYKSNVTVTATASGLPAGYLVALYDGGNQLAKSDSGTVSYSIGKMKESKTLTAKIIDVQGNAQTNTDGILEKDFTITVKTGLFDKLIAFFKGLFGLLPKITLNP